MNKYIIIPMLIYFIMIISIGIYFSKQKSNDFIKEYYIGNRNLNGFVLAMTVVSTYIGASSFISGPAVVNKYGLSWVLLASTQIPVVFLTLGILGKKIALISRKINAITIIDILKYRYNNKYLILIISLFLLIFLFVSTVAQFIGGARLLEIIMGVDYTVALTIFSISVIVYTSIGGFKTITITDTIQSIIMILAIIIIFISLTLKGGGINNITNKILLINENLVHPTFNGKLAKEFIMSFFVLVGIGILALPSITVRCMAFKDTKALHKSIIYGTITIGFIILGIHLIGYLSIVFEPSTTLGDRLIPYLSLKHLHPFLVGIFIGGPLFAIMSSVDSLLIIISSTLVKDLYIEYINKDVNNAKIKKISLLISFISGLIIYIIALYPPNFIVWINLFSLSGQETIFFVPLIFGLFSKKITDVGAITSILFGTTTLIVMTVFKMQVYHLHNIIPALLISIIGYRLFNRYGIPLEKSKYETFGFK